MEARSTGTGRTLRLLQGFGVKFIQDEFTGHIPTEGEKFELGVSGILCITIGASHLRLPVRLVGFTITSIHRTKRSSSPPAKQWRFH
jgi:hypothetical protein